MRFHALKLTVVVAGVGLLAGACGERPVDRALTGGAMQADEAGREHRGARDLERSRREDHRSEAEREEEYAERIFQGRRTFSGEPGKTMLPAHRVATVTIVRIGL